MCEIRINDPGLRAQLKALRSFVENPEVFNDKEAFGRFIYAYSQWVIDAHIVNDTENLFEGLKFLQELSASRDREGDNFVVGQISPLAEVTLAAWRRAGQAVLIESVEQDSPEGRILKLVKENPSIFGIKITDVITCLSNDFSEDLIEQALLDLSHQGCLMLTTRMVKITALGGEIVERIHRQKGASS